MSFKVPPTNVNGKEAGYRRVSKYSSRRREFASESEEVLVEIKAIFNER